jgi:hypothetical protein
VATAVGAFNFLALKTDEADIRAVAFGDIHRMTTEEAEGSCVVGHFRPMKAAALILDLSIGVNPGFSR